MFTLISQVVVSTLKFLRLCSYFSAERRKPPGTWKQKPFASDQMYAFADHHATCRTLMTYPVCNNAVSLILKNRADCKKTGSQQHSLLTRMIEHLPVSHPPSSQLVPIQEDGIACLESPGIVGAEPRQLSFGALCLASVPTACFQCHPEGVDFGSRCSSFCFRFC